jgi:hypothetical protein
VSLLLRLLLFLAFTALGGYFAARVVVRTTRRLLGYDDTDPADKASQIAQRIYRQLEASAGAQQMYGPVLAQIDEIVQARLPRLSATRDRLNAYLRDKRRDVLDRQIDDLRRELASTTDPALALIVEKNLALALERLESHGRITVLHDRTVAQIRNVLLTLEALEDRVVSVKLAEKDQDLAPALEGMLDEVNQLESEYRRLQLLE